MLQLYDRGKNKLLISNYFRQILHQFKVRYFKSLVYEEGLLTIFDGESFFMFFLSLENERFTANRAVTFGVRFYRFSVSITKPSGITSRLLDPSNFYKPVILHHNF